MSTTKRTRIPNKPILSSTVTKVVSGKVVKTGKATTPQRAKPKKLVSGEQREVSAIHPVHKSDKKDNRKLFSESETDSEILHSPRNSNQNSFSSTHSNQSTPKRDSLESLKKQINELSKYSFQQSQLIGVIMVRKNIYWYRFVVGPVFIKRSKSILSKFSNKKHICI